PINMIRLFMTGSLQVCLWLCPFGKNMVTHGLQTGESVIPFCLQVVIVGKERADPCVGPDALPEL
ncbi:MAG: hypothetical protein U9N80_12575, partial [Chloroflexota bacterium]|nr:hypothetical protein [Chloroflexota bacterium]